MTANSPSVGEAACLSATHLVSGDEVSSAVSARRVLNFNLGIVGHVDSGKTSLARALSTHLSTSSLDKAPQSQQRGITLDLGFSAFYLSPPPHIAAQSPHYQLVQYTLVDCPGHSSLLRSIIGGSSIIDCMLLVIDAQRGIQPQTAECLVLGEILVRRLVVCANKCDLLPSDEQRQKLERGLRQTFKSTKFGADLPIVFISSAGSAPSIAPLLAALSSADLSPPQRSIDAPLYLPVDHSFSIKGQGLVLTGTVLTGRVVVGDSVYLPTLRQSRKVKSLQCFHTSVQSAVAGERVAVCVSGLEGEKVERGLLCAPNAVEEAVRVVVWAEKVRFYKAEVRNGQSLHISVGHETLMASCTFFASSTAPSPSSTAPTSFDLSQPYLLLPSLPTTPCYVLLTFSQPVFLPSHLRLPLIASHLNANYTGKSCRLAFSAHQLLVLPPPTSPPSPAPTGLRLYKDKRKEGVVDRVQPSGEWIGRGMFEAAEEVGRYVGMRLGVEGVEGVSAVIEGGFAKGGKFRIRVDHSGSGEQRAGSDTGWVGKKLTLCYKQFLPDEVTGKKRITQD